MSLLILEDVLKNAAADLLNARNALARARTEISSANTSLPRAIVADADKVVEHLKRADGALADVLRQLHESGVHA
jgi:hypothetical protein